MESPVIFPFQIHSIHNEYNMKKSIKILLVEDEAVTAMWLDKEFKRAGYNVFKWVVTGEEAVKSAEQDHPDLIAMDIRLGGKVDGIEIARQISSRFNIRILFITGYQNQDFINRAKALNPIGYFIKPLDFAKIKTAIDSAFRSNKKLRR